MNRLRANRMGRGVGAILVTLGLLGVMLPPAVLAVGQALSGTVTSGGSPVAGAIVVALGSGDNKLLDVTDGSGAYSIDVTDDTYDLAVQAPGYAVAEVAGVAVSGAPVTQDVSLTSSGAKFEALGVYGGQIGTILPDGRSGVFYASTSVIPQFYRSADYGGTWTPVTMEIDDATNGLSGSTNIFRPVQTATSGHPGEVAVIIGSTAYHSDDFGVTWRAISGTMPSPADDADSLTLFWGHAGSTSVMLAVSATGSARADMTATSPAWSTMATPYAPNATAMAVANGEDSPYVAVVSNTGTLTVYGLTATGDPAQVGDAVSGFPANATLVRFGGGRAAGAPPAAVLVYSGTSGNAVMATKDPAATSFASGDLSASTAVGNGCGAGPGAIGSVAPASSGANGNGTVAMCWVTKSGTSALTLAMVNGVNNNTGFAFDAAYDGSANQVILSGDGSRGVIKSASSAGGIPVFDSMQDADPGTDPSSGGVAVKGFTVPVVKETAIGPAAGQIATMLSPSGGGLGLASSNGAAANTMVVRKGGYAVRWWEGASDDWLVFGHSGAGDLLTAVAGWTSAAAPLAAPNVSGTGSADLGGSGQPENFGISALEGITGSDALFIGWFEGNGTGGGLVRATLSNPDAPAIGGVTTIGGSTITEPVSALAYCPSAGSASSVADSLFVAMGGAQGGLAKVTDPTGTASVSLVTEEAMGVNDVRVDCSSGTVWAGTGSNGGGPSGSLMRSTDGGSTLAPVTISAPGVPNTLNVQVVALNPSDPNEVIIAGNSEGFIIRSVDAGGTWAVVNNPQQGGRNFLSEGIGDLEIPPSALPTSAPVRRGPSVSSSEALVGTGGGLFAGSIRPAVPATWTTSQLTQDAGDATPAVAVDGAGKVHLAYARSGTNPGIYYRTNKSGSWVTTRISTVVGDASPSLALDGNGRAHLAFSRSGTNPGIYYSTNASGSWATARRSTVSGDRTPTLALDDNGKIHVAFQRTGTNPGIYYLTNRSGSWTTTRVTTVSSDKLPAIAVDAADKAHLAFARAGTSPGIHYATNKTGSWVLSRRSTVAGDTAPAIAVDANGKVHLAFSRTGTGPGIYHVTNKTGSWVSSRRSTVLGDATPVIDLSATGKVHLAFSRSGTNPGVYYDTDRTGSWVRTRISTGTADNDPGIDFDKSGKVHLAFAGGNVAIYHVTNASGSWVTSLRSNGADGRDAALATDANGKVHLAFSRTGTDPGIYYGTNKTGSWVIAQRSAVAGDGEPAIAVDANGKVHLAFARSGGTPGIYYLTNRTGSWVTSRVTGTTAGDGEPAIAVDANGKVHLAFTRAGTGPGIYYATNKTGSWVSSRRSTVAGDGLPAIALDDNGKVHLAFGRTGGTTFGIHYQTNQTGSWVDTRISTVAGDTLPAVAVDAADKPHIAFARTGTNPGVYYATNKTGSWLLARRSTVAGDTAPAIDLDSNGKVHLAFERPSSGSPGIYYVTNKGGVWASSRRTTVLGDGDPVLAIGLGNRVQLVLDRGTSGLFWLHT